MSPSVGERVASNATLLLISRILSRLIGLGVIVLVSRLLGAQVFGKFSFAFSFVGLFAAIVGMGLTTFVTREIARRRDEAGAYLASALVLKVGLLAVGVVALAVATHATVPDSTSRLAIYLAAVSLFAASFTSIVNGAFRAFESMQYEVLGFVVGKLVLLGLCALCYVARTGLGAVVGAFAASSLIELAVACGLLRTRLVRSGYRVSVERIRTILRETLPFALGAVLGVIYFRIDTVMLRFLKGDLATGWYGGAYRFVEAAVFLPEMMAAALFPVLARKFFSAEPLSGVFARAFRLFFVLGLPFALGATLLPRIALLLGADFGGSVEVLPFLGWTLFLLFLNYLLATTLFSTEKQRVVTAVMACGALSNIVLNLLFIPRWGHVGAGMATLTSTSLVFAGEWVSARRSVGATGLGRVIIKPAIAGVLLCLVWLLFGGENLVWVIPAGVGAYILALSALRGFPSEDMELLRGALGSARAQATGL